MGPTPRRFIVSAYAETGARLSVLPTVQQEFRSAAAAYDVRLASRVIAGLRAQGREFTAEREAEVLKTVATQAGDRFVEKLKREEVWRFLEPSFRERSETKDLAGRLPDDCFREKNAAADKRILAETVFHGMNGVVSADARSIDHPGVDRWARDTGVLRSPEWNLVVETDTAFRQLCEGRDAGKAMLWRAAAAVLPPVARDDEETVRLFATQLAKSGFSLAHAQVRQGLDAERSLSRFLAEVRAERTDASRRIEEERRKTVRDAAEEACWGWP